MSTHLDAALNLLDRQVVDRDGEAVGKVDDLELSDARPGDDAPEVVALLLGPEAYGHRLGGLIGKWYARAGAMVAGTPEPIRISLDAVADVGVTIRLNVSMDDLDRPPQPDRWLARHFIGRIPGAHDAS